MDNKKQSVNKWSGRGLHSQPCEELLRHVR